MASLHNPSNHEIQEYYILIGENQVLGLLLLLRKSSTSVAFVKEWLNLCEDEEMLSPKKFHPEIVEFPDYVSHREDQSVLNLLRLKYNIPVCRMI